MKKIYFLFIALGLFTSANAQVINFPDANFKAKLLSLGIDTDNDGEISQAEALGNWSLNLDSSNISDLTGLEYFINATDLSCKNNLITTLSLSGFTHLYSIDCSYNNHLTNVVVTNINDLRQLFCNNSQVSSLTISNLPGLMELYCQNNQLASLTIDNFPRLSNIRCYQNQLTSLNISNLSFAVVDLQCWGNQLTTLNISNSNISSISCHTNLFSTINVSNISTLSTLYCHNNPNLKSIFFKNGRNGSGPSGILLSGCPNLEYVCVDENRIPAVINDCNNLGYTNVNVNSYCSFVPGGTFYTIQGNAKYDENGNGCDVLDANLPNLKYSITNGTNSGVMIANTSGNYSIPVQAGTHTVLPILENPTYFNISPASVSVSFPVQGSPFTQDFCVSANGVHPDLEVVLLPTSSARPGFVSDYRLVYKNKGNQIQSGTLALTFDDSKLDLVTAAPTVDSQVFNLLNWNFINLMPFETREIYVSLHINAPTDAPAVNGGDQLNFTAVISPVTGDEIPYDNTSALKQTVINAFDPNDKTCLEGTTIAPSEVGKYVHYLIRFENNGTANAHNIVVKDMIDTAKFDINTLVPIKGSHSFVTNITAGNKVEFIFENINLPFDDANNDGYVAFKIKTLPTLINGDMFSNTASIYFDYNFPILTNTAVTTIQALSTQDFAFGTYFTLYPNPVNDVLNIETKQTIEVSSVSIYNQLGQLVLVIPNAQNTKSVDVSSLSSGNYFIKINSDKGTSNTKFIKQ